MHSFTRIHMAFVILKMECFLTFGRGDPKALDLVSAGIWLCLLGIRDTFCHFILATVPSWRHFSCFGHAAPGADAPLHRGASRACGAPTASVRHLYPRSCLYTLKLFFFLITITKTALQFLSTTFFFPL